MMSEPERLRAAQDYVTRELQEYGKTNGMTWNQDPLGIRLSASTSWPSFTEERNRFSPSANRSCWKIMVPRNWKKDLRSHIGEILIPRPEKKPVLALRFFGRRFDHHGLAPGARSRSLDGPDAVHRRSVRIRVGIGYIGFESVSLHVRPLACRGDPLDNFVVSKIPHPVPA